MTPSKGSTPAPRRDLTGRRFVVTGANSGIGESAARLLAERGATVVLACRDTGRAAAAAERIADRVPQAELALGQLDLASLASVRAFAESTVGDGRPVDVLVNNAGVMALPRRETADGFEMQIGTNHLGHFALTGLLLPALLRAESPRVVTVSSLAHKTGAINLADLQSEQGYSKRTAYAQSKLANLLFAFELQRRADTAGIDLLSLAAHPGLASSNLSLGGPRMDGSRLGLLLGKVYNAVTQSSDAGAGPTVMAATRSDVTGGDYFGPSGPAELWGGPRKVSATPAAHDAVAASLLWQQSEQLTGVTYDAFTPRA